MKEYNTRVAATMGWGRGNCHKRRRGGGGLASYRGIFPDIIKLVVPRETRVKVTAVENAQESTNKLYNKFFFKTVREIIILFTKILSLSQKKPSLLRVIHILCNNASRNDEISKLVKLEI